MSSQNAKLIGVAVMLATIYLIYVLIDVRAAKSFAYGNIVALFAALIIDWRLWQAKRCGRNEPEWILRQAKKTVFERYVWAAVMMGLGFKLMEITPIWLLVGFVVGQVVWLFASIWIRLRLQNDD